MLRRRNQPGFTLLELVLVMVILTIAMGMIAPSFRGWSRGAKFNAATDGILSLARRARTQAVSDGQVYRMQYDDTATARRWKLLKLKNGTNTGEFEAIEAAWAKSEPLPEGYTLTIIKDQTDNPNVDPNSIDFYPTGRTEPVTIKLTGLEKDQVVLECVAPTELLHVATDQQTR